MITYKDIKDVEMLFQCLPEVRLRRVFTYRESLSLAEQILDRKFKTERAAIFALYNHFNNPEQPKECNCPPANGTRWMVSPVLVHYNQAGEQFPYLPVIKEAVSEVMAACGVILEFTNNEREAHIVISNGEIDGRNGTFGQAYVPVSGDDMAACGRMCGDILIDESEAWSKPFFKTVFLHELLHALGIPHNTDRRSIMYSRYLGPRSLHAMDKAQLLRRYPRRQLT